LITRAVMNPTPYRTFAAFLGTVRKPLSPSPGTPVAAEIARWKGWDEGLCAWKCSVVPSKDPHPTPLPDYRERVFRQSLEKSVLRRLRDQTTIQTMKNVNVRSIAGWKWRSCHNSLFFKTSKKIPALTPSQASSNDDLGKEAALAF
jgi:hypothetical protein